MPAMAVSLEQATSKLTFLREGFGFNFQIEIFLPKSSIELQQQNSSDQDIKSYLRSIDRRIGNRGIVGGWIDNPNSDTSVLIVNVDMQVARDRDIVSWAKR
ncbi:uncharacterized protein Bfra_009753 [Botrytis fragariae]|uniref:Uncharacterized protein n=1 Tax=Botrytis fragariae TaxID=1964551 RepID=A0A8H6AMZ0_9HELO|nr:uncharacterized protein Bfra_009753 [Botrytis fragariae]KAF5870369.1 hypothetical protein Bfra_009753 [Botrytis fragariae]